MTRKEIQNTLYYGYKKDELKHHGVKGQKWGVRRYQNPDGSLTEKGKSRYSELSKKDIKKTINTIQRISSKRDSWGNGHNASDKDIREAVAASLKGKISIQPLLDRKKELSDFQKENLEALKKAKDDIYNKVDENLQSEVDRLAKKYKVDPYMYAERLSEEAWISLESKYETEYNKTPLGKKENQLLDNVMGEYEKIGIAAVSSYGNTPLKNVYTYKSGQKTQAVLSDVMKQVMYELDNDRSYERRFN